MHALARFVIRHPRLFVLTGAGVSTASGIPGYRDAEGRWTRTPPVRIDEFLHSAEGRRRYWHRSMNAWRRLGTARPNAAHRALARLEAIGHIALLVTQNVDGLHQRAGSRRVVELHGNALRVGCLTCGAAHSRAAIQQALEAHNAQFLDAPDGVDAASGEADADTGDRHVPDDFVAPACSACGGMLKPDVVFFGENVPRDRVDAARAALETADAMLVVGSSLMVYSGFRFCEWAVQRGKPVAAINLGRTRADPLLALKVAEPCGEALAALLSALKRRPDDPMPAP
jgi:NAD-dependent SIR2 family protein deacetylase